jgi:hypothetical protein
LHFFTAAARVATLKQSAHGARSTMFKPVSAAKEKRRPASHSLAARRPVFLLLAADRFASRRRGSFGFSIAI